MTRTTHCKSPLRRNGRRLWTVLLALVGLALALAVAPTAEAETISIGEVAPASVKGTGCSSCTSLQLESAPGTAGYTVPPGRWTLTSWSGQGGQKGGPVRLDVFRPTGEPGQYRLLAQTGFESMPAGAVSSFPATIPVEGGDVLGLMTGLGSGYPPSVITADPGDVAAGVGGAPEVGQAIGPGSAYATTVFGQRRLNIAATLSRADAPAAPPAPTNVLSLLAEGHGAVATTGGELHCPSACAAAFPAGTSVSVVATPGPRAELARWGGACAGTGPSCVVTLTGDLQVSAKFVPGHGLALGQLKRRKGRTTQKVVVENRGAVRVAGRGLVAATVAAKRPGAVKLPLAVRGKALRTLEETGLVKVMARVTFVPDGGTPNMLVEKVVLRS